MARIFDFTNERGNAITLEIRPAAAPDELTYVLTGPTSTTEHTLTELEAGKLVVHLQVALRCRAAWCKLATPLTARARELGYGLAVHGSLLRDIDLVACPWTDAAVPARELAMALQATAAEHNNGVAEERDHVGAANPDYFHQGCPGAKPHGRLVWSFHLGGGPYIDLSVMPRQVEEPEGR